MLMEIHAAGSASAPAPTRRTRSLPSSRPLYPGQPALSIYGDANVDNAAMLAEVSVLEGVGSVHMTRMKLSARKRRAKDLKAVHLSAGGDLSSLVFDAALYSGKNRDIGVRVLDRAWVDFQIDMGLPYAYTDSPYIPAGDAAALQGVLAQSASMRRPVVAVLPLAIEWLKAPKARQHLIEEINTFNVPVALVLEHKKDPLGVQAAATGLVQLLAAADVPVVLLRSDVSTIGALACGASMGAVGTRSGYRHLFPIPTSKGAGHDSRISLFVPFSMAYRRVDTLALAMAKAPAEQNWFECYCSYCGGGLLDRVDSHERASRHSMAALALLAEQVLMTPAGPAAAAQSWKQRCSHAQHVNLDLNARLDGGWEPPDFQGAWLVALHNHDA